MTNPLRANADHGADTADIEIELQTALALARASTQALLQLSPLAHREIAEALAHEIGLLERRGDTLSLAAANAVRTYLPQAA